MTPWYEKLDNLPRSPQCADCGFKSGEDHWEEHPEGYYDVGGDCLCEECALKETSCKDL